MFVAGEVILECMIPLVMSRIIDRMSAESISPIIKYGVILLIMATVSLGFGVLSARNAAEASCGFAKNLRQDMYFKIQDHKRSADCQTDQQLVRILHVGHIRSSSGFLKSTMR